MNLRPQFLDRIISKVRSLFRNEYRAPRTETPTIRVNVPQRERGYQARMELWCHNFMRRNRGIVPARSPQSIYLDAVRPRRRKQ